MYTYRPADEYSSEEDDYDGWSFGGPGHDNSPKEDKRSFWVADPEQELCNAVTNGNLEALIKQIEEINFDINAIISGGYTLLHHACKHGQYEIVRYLIDQNAKVNRQVDSTTPLMEACCCTENLERSGEIVKLLLDKGAVVNISDKYGMTPFIFACRNGLTDVVKLLLPYASLESCDNQDQTAIFHAIEGNHPEVVKILVEANVNINISNRKGYTPRQVAQFHGFSDIIDLLPPEEYRYFVPSAYLSYSSFRDYIPRIFLKSKTPEYFQEIHTILCSLKLEKFLNNFASHKIDLTHFLTMNDEQLKNIGVEYSFHRGKIKLGLLDYHLNHWRKSSVVRVSRQASETFYDILMLSANHLQNLLTILSSIQYVRQNLEQNLCGRITSHDVGYLKESLKEYKTVLLRLRKTVKYLSSFSPEKPPLLIDFNEYKTTQKRRKYMKNCVKYSIFIGISIVICLKIKKII